MDPDRIKCPNCENKYTAEQWTTEDGKFMCPNCGTTYTNEQLTHAGRWTAYVIIAILFTSISLFLLVS